MKNIWLKLTALQQFVAGLYISKNLKFEARDAHLSSPKWIHERVAEIEDVIIKDREAQTRPVTRFEDFDILKTPLKSSSFQPALRCTHYLR